MDEKEKLPDQTPDETTPLPEFTLEDIMKEFGSGTEPEPAAEEEDVRVYTPGETTSRAEVTGDTIIVDPKEIAARAARAAMEGETVRLDVSALLPQIKSIEEMARETIRFTPLGQTEPEPEPAPAPQEQTPAVEPFSEGWEPQYEEPMGEYNPSQPRSEYIPPEPIVFRPRSRLRELKRKLVEGPERRYYALMEKGVGKLQIAIFFSLLVVVLAVVSIVMNHLGLVHQDRMRLLVFGEIFAMLVAAMLASNQLVEGLTDLLRGHFTMDSLLLVSFVACILDGLFCLRQVRVPFCAAFCLEVSMSLWAELQRRSTEISQMDTLRRAVRLNRVTKAPDCCEGRPGFCVTEGEVEDFMDTYNQPTGPEKKLSLYALLATLASMGIGVYAGIRGGLAQGLQAWSAAILAAAPATMFICQSRPAAILERRLSRFGSLICGWQGTKAMSGQAVVPLKDTDLMPSGSVKINGVKFYTARDADQIIAYTTALMNVSGNGLYPLFEQLLESRNGRHCDVGEFKLYGTVGMGGIVDGESVLLGTQAFLKDMGVEMPDGAHVSQAVYVSVEGEFCAVFALAFGKLKGVSAGLHTLSGYRGLTPLLASDNFLLTEDFIRAKYGVNTRRFAFPESQIRRQVAAWSPEPETWIPCALTTQEGLTGMAFAITGARSLRSACNWGAVVHMIGGVVGLLSVLALTVAGAGSLLTPPNLLLFELIWAMPGLLFSSWTRHL